MQQWGLVGAGLAVALHGRGFELLLRHAAVIELVAILATGATPGIRAVVGQGQSRVGAQLGDEVQMALLGQVPGVVVAKAPIPHQTGAHSCLLEAEDQAECGLKR